MKKQQVDVYLVNRLLSSMNEKLLLATPDKIEAVQTVMFAMAEEIFAVLNISPSLNLINLTQDNKLKSFKLLPARLEIGALFSVGRMTRQKSNADPKLLKDRIIAVCARKDILSLLTEDPDILIPIILDIIQLIQLYIGPKEIYPNIDLINHAFFYNDQHKAHKINPFPDAIYSKYQKLKIQPAKDYQINPIPFFKEKMNYPLQILGHHHQILDQFIHQHAINLFDHYHEDLLADLKRRLKEYLIVTRFLLFLVDKDGNRFMPLTQLNLVAVCAAIPTHADDLKVNQDRLERLYYLCSQSKRFSCQVIDWMRMYVQHCTANDLPISFPELLLTYCKNFPEYVNGKGPLPLKTLCAILVRDRIPRHRVHHSVALELADEENVQPNGIGDDQNVVELLSSLINEESTLSLMLRWL